MSAVAIGRYLPSQPSHFWGDLELTDPSELRRVVAEVEQTLGVKSPLRLSFLTAEEWRFALYRSLSPALRKQAERHVHLLVDRTDPRHLLFSPSAVIGISEREPRMYAEVIHHVLWRTPTELEPKLRRGVDSLLAEWLGGDLGVRTYSNYAPAEKQLASILVTALSRQFGHAEQEWALLMRRDPGRFFGAFARSRLGRHLLDRARKNGAAAASALSIVDELRGGRNEDLEEIVRREGMAFLEAATPGRISATKGSAR